MQEQILIVDDEKEIADLVTIYLENENFKVFTQNTAKGAYSDRGTSNIRTYHTALFGIWMQSVLYDREP